MTERGGHTALHLACRVRAHTCAYVLLQPRPSHPRDASDTYLTQSQDHTPDTSHAPVATDPQPNPGNEEEPRDEDWRLQLEAENYDGEGPGPQGGCELLAPLAQPEMQLMPLDIAQLVGCLSGICKALGSIPSVNSMVVYAYNTLCWEQEEEFKVILVLLS